MRHPIGPVCPRPGPPEGCVPATTGQADAYAIKGSDMAAAGPTPGQAPREQYHREAGKILADGNQFAISDWHDLATLMGRQFNGRA